MEGPTPVSALIHAATMVTAGVYMVVRSNVLYDNAPLAAGTVAIIGGVTLFMAATIATVQVDIKRVLAWSTVSQIGYMMLGAGLGLYGAAMFHLMSHAFFKALLFLSVGIVIHALLGEQSMNKMGGLKRYLPVPYMGVLVGCFAISGIPPFSGFFSKDEILALAVDSGTLGLIVGILGILGAGLTAFYMFRLLFRSFWGPDPEGGYDPAPHPSRWIMTTPVVILALLAFFGGWIQVPDGWALVDDWLEPVLFEPEKTETSVAAEVLSSVASLVLVAIAIGVAYWLFAKGPARRRRYADKLTRTREVLHEGYYFDTVYDTVFVDGGRKLGDALTQFERHGIRGSMLAVGRAARDAGRAFAATETGLVRTYVFAMIAGLAIVGFIFLLVVLAA
jgi:NADH-quinone oxidoreductase subunit L